MLHIAHHASDARDFPLTVTADGFAWEIPAGTMTIRYVTTIKDDTWHEALNGSIVKAR